MSASGQIVATALRHSPLDVQGTGIASSRIERRREMVRPEGRRLDGLLEGKAELNDVQEELERPLVLAVSARAGECQVRRLSQVPRRSISTPACEAR